MEDSSLGFSRREIKFRSTKFAQSVAAWLSSKNISPNAISVSSVVFSLVAMILSYIYSLSPNAIYPFVIAVLIQLRLLCNLFDGMVAIEGGKRTLDGQLYNEIPCRLSDSFIIIGLGFLASNEFAQAAVWLSFGLATLSAYIRLLGVTMGLPEDFSGFMAKQKRMALITVSFAVFGVMEIIGASELAFDLASDTAIMFLFIGLVITCTERVIKISRLVKSENNGK